MQFLIGQDGVQRLILLAHFLIEDLLHSIEHRHVGSATIEGLTIEHAQPRVGNALAIVHIESPDLLQSPCAAIVSTGVICTYGQSLP